MVADASLANLQPAWQPGATPKARRNREVELALRKARKFAPEAIQFCADILRAPLVETVDADGKPLGELAIPLNYRLKAAEIILLHGMPKGEAAQRAFIEGDVGAITIHIEHHVAPAAQPEPTQPEGPVITIDTEPAGSGD